MSNLIGNIRKTPRDCTPGFACGSNSYEEQMLKQRGRNTKADEERAQAAMAAIRGQARMTRTR